MTPQQYCEQKVRQSGSSFYYSFLFLEPKQREAMIALYAFCREIDDVVDSPKTKNNNNNISFTKLQWWKQEISNCFSSDKRNSPSHPIALAIKASLMHYNFELEHFLDIITGMTMDLQHTGFETMEDLNNYCYHVAGAVGLLTIEITGYNLDNKQQMHSYAKNLANALQLINILRDIKEDLSIGRIYIPRKLMNEFSIHLNDLKQDKANLQLLKLFNYLSDQADRHYQKAMLDLPKEDRYQQRSGLIMANIYLAILAKIKKQNYPVLKQRVKLNPLKKLWIAWATVHKESSVKSKLQKT